MTGTQHPCIIGEFQPWPFIFILEVPGSLWPGAEKRHDSVMLRVCFQSIGVHRLIIPHVSKLSCVIHCLPLIDSSYIISVSYPTQPECY